MSPTSPTPQPDAASPTADVVAFPAGRFTGDELFLLQLGLDALERQTEQRQREAIERQASLTETAVLGELARDTTRLREKLTALLMQTGLT